MDIQLERISFKYPQSPGKAILDHVHLAIASGEAVAIVGRSGTGKSTLLKMINGLLKPDTGNVLLNGQPFHYRRACDLLDRSTRINSEVTPLSRYNTVTRV